MVPFQPSQVAGVDYNQLFNLVSQSLNKPKPPLIQRTTTTPQITDDFEDRFYEQDNFSDPVASKDYVIKTYDHYANYRRTTGHEQRWLEADRLYAAYVKPHFWKGTRIPRSNLGVPYCFEQIETSKPYLRTSIFNTGENWFQLSPEAGLQHQDARIIEGHLEYRFMKAKLASKVSLAISSMLKYGLGALELIWDDSKDFNESLDFKYVDIRDFFLDPNVHDHEIESSRALIRKTSLTISELLDLRDTDPRFTIPDMNTLVSLYSNFTDIADQQKELALKYLGLSPSIAEERLSVLWGDRPLNTLILYSKKRVIWVIERSHTIYDQPNQDSFYPYVFLPCFPGENSVYPRGFPDIIGNNQKYGTGLINVHMDNKAISSNPPRVKSSLSQTSGTDYWFPGAQYSVDQAKDLQLLLPKGIETDVSSELSFLERMTEKAIGNNALTQGVPAPGNINRTRAGVQSQLQGASNRNGELLNNVMDYGLTPLVEKAYKFCKSRLQENGDIQQPITVLTPEGLIAQVQAAQLFGPYAICPTAPDRLITKGYLQQFLPFITGPLVQLFSSPVFAESMYVPQYDELIRLILTAIGAGRRFSLVREKTDEDIQRQQQMQQEAQQQQQQGNDAAKLQMKQMDMQTRLELGKMKSDTSLQVAQLGQQSKFSELDLKKLLEDEETSRMIIKLILERGSYKPLAESLAPKGAEAERRRQGTYQQQRREERRFPVLGAQSNLEQMLLQEMES